MPWTNTTTMEQKVEFIMLWKTQKHSITDLCKKFRISRPTAYKWIKRFQNEDYPGLMDRSSKAKNYPNQTDQKIIKQILKLKKKHKDWGAKKLRMLLFDSFTENKIPSINTVHSILKKHDLVRKQRRVKRIEPINPIFDPKECNEIWSADFKGKFKMGNLEYCCPLTIQDSKSRLVLSAKAMPRETFKDVKREFTRVFRKYGMPKQIHTDNGSPFGSPSSIQRFSRLSYWFIDLGIEPVFSDPARPDQNGRHERMHRDLKAFCAKPAAYDMKAQQRLLNKFVKQYNHVRPHEALDMNTPFKAHELSSKTFPERIKKYIYPPGLKIMNVTKSGSIRWDSYYWVFLTSALIGKKVAAQELGNGIWKIFYRDVALGYFSEKDIRQKQQTLRISNNLV